MTLRDFDVCENSWDTTTCYDLIKKINNDIVWKYDDDNNLFKAYSALVKDDKNKLCKDKNKEKSMKNFYIKNYKVCDNNGIKTVVVEFADGIKTHAVCCKEDVFDLSRGIELCVLKYVLGNDTYKEIVRKANSQVKEIDRTIAKIKKDEEEEKALIERKKAKAAKRKAKRLEKERANRVAEIKEGYLAAMREYGEEACTICEASWDDLK